MSRAKQPPAKTDPALDAAGLNAAGLNVDHRVGGDGAPVWRVRGTTHPHRQMLRDSGGQWDKLDQCWVFTGADPSAQLAAKLAALPPQGQAGDNLGPKLGDRPHYWGHRQRLRERFMGAGEEALADYELLELLLFYSIPRRDVKPLAKQLIEKFGSFAGVLAADPARLAEIDELAYPSIVHFKAVRAAALRMTQAEVLDRPVIGSWQKLLDYCRASMAHNKTEQFRLLFLDRKNVLIADEVQQQGTVDHTPVYPREVVKRALELGASSLIMVHNHPSGDPTPSRADIEMTKEVAAAAQALGISLHDHIVVGKKNHASFKSLGLL